MSAHVTYNVLTLVNARCCRPDLIKCCEKLRRIIERQLHQSRSLQYDALYRRIRVDKMRTLAQPLQCLGRVFITVVSVNVKENVCQFDTGKSRSHVLVLLRIAAYLKTDVESFGNLQVAPHVQDSAPPLLHLGQMKINLSDGAL